MLKGGLSGSILRNLQKIYHLTLDVSHIRKHLYRLLNMKWWNVSCHHYAQKKALFYQPNTSLSHCATSI